MEELEKEFVPYDRSLRLKALGFDEPCLGLYYDDGKTSEFAHVSKKGRMTFLHNSDEPMRVTKVLYQQAFRWFREKYDLHLLPIRSVDKWYSTFGSWIASFEIYEQAELACLDKLLEIVEGIESQK